MSITIPGRVVVFDYGEVISRTPSEADRAVLVRLAGVDADAFWPTYWRYRDELDQGTLSTTAYWQRLAAEFGAAWSASRLHELWVADFRGWWSVEPGTVDLIDELHAGGTRLAILSNAGADFASGFRFSPLGRYFERIFVSAEMEAIKPDPAIYLEVADGLGIAPQQMVFIDNKSVNTDAAAALGMTVHHFTTVTGLEQFLRSLAA